MTVNGWLQILFFLVLILLVTKPMGLFMTHVFNRERTFLVEPGAALDYDRSRRIRRVLLIGKRQCRGCQGSAKR